MKLKHLILLSIMLQLPAVMYASDLMTDIATATENLISAQTALASLLGLRSIVTVNTTSNTVETITADLISTQIASLMSAQAALSSLLTIVPTQTVINSASTQATPSTQTVVDSAPIPIPAPTYTAAEKDVSTPATTPAVVENVVDIAPTPIAAPTYLAPIDANNKNDRITTMITNDATQTVYLVMFDQNTKQINPTNISLAHGEFSYIPSNVATVQVVDNGNQQLVAATPITLNSLYSLTNTNNSWDVVTLPAPTAPVTYSYTNSTTLPLVIAITAGNIINSQQIAPGDVYAQTIDPSTMVTVKVHANIAAILTSYNPALSYNLTISSKNKLTLTSTSGTDKTLTNNSGWPMLINMILPDNAHDYIVLEDGSQYEPSESSISIMAIPLIPNNNNSIAPTKSCTITNKSGQLALQF
jgi:hypothetical protein